MLCDVNDQIDSIDDGATGGYNPQKNSLTAGRLVPRSEGFVLYRPSSFVEHVEANRKSLSH